MLGGVVVQADGPDMPVYVHLFGDIERGTGVVELNHLTIHHLSICL